MLASTEEINLEIQTRVESGLADGNDRSHQKKLTRYITYCHDRPQLADDKVPLKILEDLSKDLPRVTFATTAMLEDCPAIMFQATHVVIDEAGQACVAQIIPLLCMAPNLKTVLFTGDEKQLLNYTEDVPETVLDFGFKSLLIHAMELQSPVVKTL